MLTAPQAVQFAAQHLGIVLLTPITVQQKLGGVAQAAQLSDGGISEDPIPAKLMYYAVPGGAVRLVWNIVIRLKDSIHWWELSVDAETGKVLFRYNRTVHDSYNVYPLPVESPADGMTNLITSGVTGVEATAVVTDFGIVPQKSSWHGAVP